MNVCDMSFEAALLSKGFGTNLTNKLWGNAAFIAGMSKQIPFIFIRL